jgi:hypothetical protein
MMALPTLHLVTGLTTTGAIHGQPMATLFMAQMDILVPTMGVMFPAKPQPDDLD